MADDADETKFWVSYRERVLAGLKEQIARHRSINPNATTAQIKTIYFKQESERLDRIVIDLDARAALKNVVKIWLDKI